MQQRKNHGNKSLEVRNILFYVNAENDGFLQFSGNQCRKQKK